MPRPEATTCSSASSRARCAPGISLTTLLEPAVRAADQPANEWKAPSAFGSFGVNGWNVYALVVSKPALPAAVLSMNGISAATAWLMFVHLRVRSYPLLFG